MAQGEPLELLSFRRTFALLILLVVVPSAGLSGFGVLAIINERAAVEKRLEAAWGGKLQTIAERFKARLLASSVEQTDGQLIVRSPEGALLSSTAFSAARGVVETSDPK